MTASPGGCVAFAVPVTFTKIWGQAAALSPECVQPVPELLLELPGEPCQPLAVADFENCSSRLTDESRVMYFYWKINISLMKTRCAIRGLVFGVFFLVL